MIPDLDLARVRKWIDQRNGDMPPHMREQLRYEVDVTDRTITVLECRPPWREDFGPEWTRFPTCRFRYTKARKQCPTRRAQPSNQPSRLPERQRPSFRPIQPRSASPSSGMRALPVSRSIAV